MGKSKSKHREEPAVHPPETLRLDRLDLSLRVKSQRTYEKSLEELSLCALGVQLNVYKHDRRAVVVFEGWDAAGKGGSIRRPTEKMDPRGYKVYPVVAPREHELRNHYLWRFWNKTPEKGEIVIWDRSWYGRVLVERVEKIIRKRDWKRAYDEINAFERMLTDDGVTLIKFWMHISKKEQLKRFREREKDPLKQYKISKEDWRNRKKWDDYVEAVHEMFDRTHRPDAPWIPVEAEHKWYARLKVLSEFVGRVDGKLAKVKPLQQ